MKNATIQRVLRNGAVRFGAIVLAGVLSIQAGNNPRVVEMQLLSFLSAKQAKGIAKAA